MPPQRLRRPIDPSPVRPAGISPAVVRSTDLSGIAAAVGSAFLGGTAAVATRFLVREVDPMMVALMRYGLAAICLTLIAGPRRSLRWRRADLP
jgi:drug/metabolite transporter (DMT)-like permease